MATWTAISVADFLLEGFNPDERTKLQEAAGGDDGLSEILAAAIAEWRGLIEAGGNELDVDTTKVPPSCRRHIIAQVRWQALIKWPQLGFQQSDQRKEAAEQADEILEAIATGERPVESPTSEATDISQAGNYGGETKIQMRTHDTSADA